MIKKLSGLAQKDGKIEGPPEVGTYEDYLAGLAPAARERVLCFALRRISGAMHRLLFQDVVSAEVAKAAASRGETDPSCASCVFVLACPLARAVAGRTSGKN